MLTRSKLAATAVVLALLVPVGVFLANRNINIGLGIQADPLEYVHVVDKGRPIAAQIGGLLQQLDMTTGFRWDAVAYQDWDPAAGASYADNARAQRTVSRSVRLPKAADYGVIGVATNLERVGSGARDGALYVIWFNTPADAENWLLTDPSIFTDSEVEARRTTYWAGKFAVYYAPPIEGRDWSPEVQRVVEEFAR
ncbi:MAG TPA: hypothetical protein VLI04_09330 [Nocardioidaceae bacterium]|nr:hypothetical protein [Nocardioidaceae bacterium]